MHPQLAAALGRLDLVTRDLRDTAGAIPASLHARKPAADCWSVNEVLEHVGLVEQLFVTSLINNIEAAQAAGLTGEVEEPPLLAEQVRMMAEDRTTKRIAPERVRPTGGVAVEAALQTIEGGHERLRVALASAEGVTLSAVTLDHRFFGTLNVYQWVDFLAAHERRHLAQVRDIAAQLSVA
jgi:hypothetical protein